MGDRGHRHRGDGRASNPEPIPRLASRLLGSRRRWRGCASRSQKRDGDAHAQSQSRRAAVRPRAGRRWLSGGSGGAPRPPDEPAEPDAELDLYLVLKTLPRQNRSVIMGRVQLAGKVIEHEDGYRAELARVFELLPVRGQESAAQKLAAAYLARVSSYFSSLDPAPLVPAPATPGRPTRRPPGEPRDGPSRSSASHPRRCPRGLRPGESIPWVGAVESAAWASAGQQGPPVLAPETTRPRRTRSATACSGRSAAVPHIASHSFRRSPQGDAFGPCLARVNPNLRSTFLRVRASSIDGLMDAPPGSPSRSITREHPSLGVREQPSRPFAGDTLRNRGPSLPRVGRHDDGGYALRAVWIHRSGLT